MSELRQELRKVFDKVTTAILMDGGGSYTREQAIDEALDAVITALPLVTIERIRYQFSPSELVGYRIAVNQINDILTASKSHGETE